MPLNLTTHELMFVDPSNNLAKLWAFDAQIAMLNHVGLLPVQITNVAPGGTFLGLWLNPQIPATLGAGALMAWNGVAWVAATTPMISAVIVRNAGGALLTGATFTGPVTLAADPTLPMQPATKQYTDNLSFGHKWKKNARLATTPVGGNIVLSGSQVVDGSATNAGDIILVKDNTLLSENGLYFAAAGAWVRTDDALTAQLIRGATVMVEEGATNADTQWHMSTDGAITLGATSLTWVKISNQSATITQLGVI
jgi:hypothetical protein